jgi:hypothetical protein
MTSTDYQYKIHCTVDEPIQRLMEKLSAKSPELYIFWVINQTYTAKLQSTIFTIF